MNLEKKSSEHYFSANPKSKHSFYLISTILRGHNFKFFTSSSVFSKNKIDSGTKLLIDTMILPDEGIILDLGCGYGPIGIVAGFINPKLKVIMTDVNSRAIDLAKINKKKNRIKNIQIKKGYLYEPVGNLIINCILVNPPISAGMKIVKKMILEAPKVLANKGSLQMVTRSKIGSKSLPSIFMKTFGNCTIISKEGGYRVLKGDKE